MIKVKLAAPQGFYQDDDYNFRAGQEISVNRTKTINKAIRLGRLIVIQDDVIIFEKSKPVDLGNDLIVDDESIGTIKSKKKLSKKEE